MTKSMIEPAMSEVQALLRPFEAGPCEWVRVPMDKAHSRFGLAMSVPLSGSACPPDVLIALISSIAEKIRQAVEHESLAAVQITFGRESGNEIRRYYRIMIPAERLVDAANLESLPESYDKNSGSINGFWFSHNPGGNRSDEPGRGRRKDI